MYEIRISTLIHCRKSIKADVQKGKAEIERMKRRREGKKSCRMNLTTLVTPKPRAPKQTMHLMERQQMQKMMRTGENSEHRNKNKRMELRPQRTE